MINREIAQQNFDVACRVYSQAKQTIRELSSYAQRVAPNFSFEIAMKQFDLILQGILLRTAMEDGYFLEEERQFIEKITDYGDIMAYFNNKGIAVRWDAFIGSGSPEEKKDLSLRMLVALKELADEFVTPFAIIDFALPRDYCAEITEQISLICIALAQCDGDASSSSDFRSEGTVALTLVNKTIKEKWDEVMANI